MVFKLPTPLDLEKEFERLLVEGNIEITCPRCKQKYVTKPMFTSVWTGCERCGRSKERIMREN